MSGATAFHFDIACAMDWMICTLEEAESRAEKSLFESEYQRIDREFHQKLANLKEKLFESAINAVTLNANTKGNANSNATINAIISSTPNATPIQNMEIDAAKLKGTSVTTIANSCNENVGATQSQLISPSQNPTPPAHFIAKSAAYSPAPPASATVPGPVPVTSSSSSFSCSSSSSVSLSTFSSSNSSTTPSQSISNVRHHHSASMAMIEDLYSVLDGVKDLERKMSQHRLSRSRTFERKSSISSQPESVSHSDGNVPADLPKEIVLNCKDQVKITANAADLSECRAIDLNTHTYNLPAVSSNSLLRILSVLRSASSSSSFSSSSSSLTAASPSSPSFYSSAVIPNSELSSIIQAVNILQFPFLFVLIAARLFLLKGSNLLFLHQLLQESFFSKLPLNIILQLEERFKTNFIEQKEKLKSQSGKDKTKLKRSSTHRSHTSMIDDNENVDVDNVDDEASILCILNMCWYSKCVSTFPVQYRHYIKFRRELPAASPSTAPVTLRWLTMFAELAAMDCLNKFKSYQLDMRVVPQLDEDSVDRLKSVGQFVDSFFFEKRNANDHSQVAGTLPTPARPMESQLLSGAIEQALKTLAQLTPNVTQIILQGNCAIDFSVLLEILNDWKHVKSIVLDVTDQKNHQNDHLITIRQRYPLVQIHYIPFSYNPSHTRSSTSIASPHLLR